ncbi:unnamed protein product [Arabidopsis halleri]
MFKVIVFILVFFSMMFLNKKKITMLFFSLIRMGPQISLVRLCL